MSLSDFFTFGIIPPWEVLLRILLACALGFFLGYERSRKGKPMGYRAYIIVCVTTALLAIMGQVLYEDYAYASEVLTIDLAKIIAGTLTGIGFLGAGAIMRDIDHKEVSGTATGASVWASGGLGLMLGFGQYALVLIGFLAIFISLTLLKKAVEVAE
ncbi:MAG: MgtC/SapB family protein [Pseudobdellovibrionaceae bacterium]